MRIWSLNKNKKKSTLPPRQFTVPINPTIFPSNPTAFSTPINNNAPLYTFVPVVNQPITSTTNGPTYAEQKVVIPIPSAPPLPMNSFLEPIQDVQVTLDTVEIFNKIKYSLERKLFTQLNEEEFGLYPSVDHIIALETKQETDITYNDIIFMKLHLEITDNSKKSTKPHCVHVRVRKNNNDYILERVLSNMREGDHLGFLTPSSR